MKEYVKLIDKNLQWDHPKLDKVILGGGGGRDENGAFHFQHYATILFKGGNWHNIDGSEIEELLTRCNDYLNTISEESKEYIKWSDKEGLTCIHPKVSKFHEWGGGAINGPMYHHCSVKMKDENEYNFRADEKNNYSAIETCNNFLNTIPE